MTASYPADVKSFTTKSNGNVVDAAHMNSVQEEIVAVQSTLGAMMGNVVPHQFGGRLSLVSGDPVPSADQTAKTMLYYTPYTSARLGMKFSTGQKVIECGEISLSLGGFAANTNFDIFLNDGATLSATAWTNGTTRATGLVRLTPGYLTLSGSPYKAYIGTIRTTGTIGQTEDSEAKRFVWNNYNRIVRRLAKTDSTSHSYTTGTWRQWNASAAQQFEFVVGMPEDGMPLSIGWTAIGGTSGGAGCGFGLDSTSATGAFNQAEANVTITRTNSYQLVGANIFGYHYLAILEYGVTGSSNFVSYSAFGLLNC